MTPIGPRVQDRRNQMIGDALNPHDRGDAGAAGEPHLGFQDVDADAAGLHVEDDEIDPSIRRDPAETGGEEFRRHDAVGRASVLGAFGERYRGA